MDKHPILCWKCGTQIRFDDRWKGRSGKKIPLNPDLTTHYCLTEMEGSEV